VVKMEERLKEAFISEPSWHEARQQGRIPSKAAKSKRMKALFCPYTNS
jgi:hypothetical protein